MLLFCAAGVSLGASAVAWWNRRKTKEVAEEIQRLQEERRKILEEHRGKSYEIAKPYLDELQDLIRHELETRKDIAPELRSALGKAEKTTKEQLGTRESGALNQVVFELEVAVGRLEAEIVHLEDCLAKIESVDSDNLWIPEPSVVNVPEDYPREGGLVQIPEGAEHLHGYHLHYQNQEEGEGEEIPGRLFALYDVDHQEKRTRACAARGKLLSAALRSGEGEIEAEVTRRYEDGVRLDFYGIPLDMETTHMEDNHHLVPGDYVNVYPQAWTFRELRRGGRGNEERNYLPVSGQPSISGDRGKWSPIPVRITEEDLNLFGEVINEAFERLTSPKLRGKPWEISLGRRSDIVFMTCGSIQLRLEVHKSADYFILDDITLGEQTVLHDSIRLFAELNLFLQDSPDSENIDSELFHKFLRSLQQELASERNRLQRRKEALELRKLSLIYEDQAAHETRASSIPVFVTDYEQKNGGAWIVKFLLLDEEPSWVTRLVRGSNDGPGVKVTTSTGSFSVESLRRKDPDSSAYTAVIPNQASTQNLNPQDIRELVNPYEGVQQRRLIRALEDTILGEYESVSIRKRILETGSGSVDHQLEGHNEALERLHDHPDIFAVWGPPGTGKTTLIVRYLREYLRKQPEEASPNILITAPTHVAVDEIMERLFQEDRSFVEEAVRYGHEDKLRDSISEEVWHEKLLSEYLSGEENENGELGQQWGRLVEKREAREAATRWFLQYATFHGATLVGMPRQDFALMDRTFDVAIIDEAGKAFGAEMLIPARLARQLVVVGDHRQLPPTITEEVVDGTIDYRLDLDEVESILRRNAFRQMFENLPKDRKAMLTTQYRMDPSIADAVSDLFYEGKIDTGRDRRGWDVTQSRLTLVDFSRMQGYENSQEKNGHSQFNEVEVEVALKILKGIATSRSDCPSIMVICPYKAQRKIVAREIENQLPDHPIEATTVDAVQGGEAEVVLLLMTRSHGSSRFLLDEHRFNVALSRSEEASIILGDVQFLARGNSGPMHELIEHGQDADTLNHVRIRDREDMKSRMVEEVVG